MMREARALLFGATTALSIGWSETVRAAPPWVDRELTLPAGNWAFDFGIGLSHAPGELPPGPPLPFPQTGAGVNAEMGVGLTNRVELGLRTGLRFGDEPERATHGDSFGRLFDRQTFDTGADVFANPELRLRGAIVRERVVEVALEGRVVAPFENGTAGGFLFGVPLAFHLGGYVRLDVGAYVPVIFYTNDTTVDLRLPVDVWIQAGSRLWLGPMTGIEVVRVGQFGSTTNVSLGMGLGYQFTRTLDLKAMFLFPHINGDSDSFGLGVGIEVRID
jgi:hypothetical protein